MKTIKTAENVKTNTIIDTHLKLVRRYGGRKIVNATIKTILDGEVANAITIPDAMLVMNPRAIHLRDFCGDKNSFFKLPLRYATAQTSLR